MRPILLQGHTRPLTRVKYNRDGDLFFSAGKDAKFNVWSSTTGELIGSYDGHTGVIWDIDINADTTRCLSASADNTIRLWDAKTGRQLHKWEAKCPVRSVAFVPGTCDKALIVTDRKMGEKCTVLIVATPMDTTLISDEPLSIFFPDPELSPATIARWGPEGVLYLGHEKGWVSCWDAMTGEKIATKQLHGDVITDLQFSEDLTYFITASKDLSSRIVDTKLNVIKTYKTTRPINSAALCPHKEHVILGGGQDAAQVTQTSDKSGKFEARFFHKILGTEFMRVKGHFGPINTIAVHPDGTQYSSGGEEGFIRMHHLDPEYFKFKLDPRDP
ncbi:WD40-repeat-containing domain protein [Blastocladiella britannica]|nr:WD40-repeat-containing domain protein [Blastocladiella britannica]